MKRARIVFLASLFAGSLILCSCSQTKNVSPAVSETTQPAAAKTGTGGSGTALLPLAAQAEKAAKDFWDDKLAHCADSYFGNYPDEKRVLECKGLSYTVSPILLTEADVKQGIEWQGVTEATAKTSRWYYSSVKYWGPWSNGLGADSYKVKMRKIDGQWEFYPSADSPARRLQALKCDQTQNKG